MKTYRFARADEVDLFVDVHTPHGEGPWPVAVHLHGGALVFGSRHPLPPYLTDKLLAAGVAVASPDYRLAPETKLPDIWSDIARFFAWLREHGPSIFRADPDRIGAYGASAGGYLSLLAGHRLDPPPRVIASFAGYGDVTAPWYSEPDDWYCSQPRIDESEARSAVGHGCPTGDDPEHDRGRFYTFLRQHGLWPREVGGLSIEELRGFCPILHVSSQYPPTALYHGTADHDVPVEESKRFVDALRECGVEHRFFPLEGVDHLCKGADPQEFESVVRKTADFMLSHLSDR